MNAEAYLKDVLALRINEAIEKASLPMVIKKARLMKINRERLKTWHTWPCAQRAKQGEEGDHQNSDHHSCNYEDLW